MEPSWKTLGKIQPGLPTVILDVDDTLSDTAPRRHLIEPPEGVKKDWPAFYGQCHLDENRDWMLDLARRLAAAGAQIAVFTGRPLSQRRPTLDWLRARGIEPALARFRGDRDFRKSPAMKGLWLDEMIAAGALPWAAVDDEPANLVAFAARGVLALDANDRDATAAALLSVIGRLEAERPKAASESACSQIAPEAPRVPPAR